MNKIVQSSIAKARVMKVYSYQLHDAIKSHDDIGFRSLDIVSNVLQYLKKKYSGKSNCSNPDGVIQDFATKKKYRYLFGVWESLEIGSSFY